MECKSLFIDLLQRCPKFFFAEILHNKITAGCNVKIDIETISKLFWHFRLYWAESL